MKVWLLFKDYGYDRNLVEIFDSKEKAIEYTKREFHLEEREYKIEDLIAQITYYLPFEPTAPDYILEEWEVK